MPAATLHRCTKLYLCCAKQYSARYSRWSHAQQHGKCVTTAQLNTNPWHLSERRLTNVTWQFCTWICLNSLMHEMERDSITSLLLGNGLVDSETHSQLLKTKRFIPGCTAVWFSCVKWLQRVVFLPTYTNVQALYSVGWTAHYSALNVLHHAVNLR